VDFGEDRDDVFGTAKISMDVGVVIGGVTDGYKWFDEAYCSLPRRLFRRE